MPRFHPAPPDLASLVAPAMLAAVLAACAGGGDSVAPLCTAGASQPCVCEDRRIGVQTCTADGTSFGACECGRRSVPRDAGDDDGLVADSEDDHGVGGDGSDEGGHDTQTDENGLDRDGLGGEVGGRDTGGSDVDSVRDIAADSPTETDTDSSTGDARPDSPPDAAPGTLELGDPCTRAAECASGICFSLGSAGRSFCTAPCCVESECPRGFGCLQKDAGRYCIPGDALGTPGGYTDPVGAPCFRAETCQSGICDFRPDEPFCRQTCCLDTECATGCRWSQTGSVLRTFCDPLVLLSGGGRTGDFCTSENDCWSGVCVATGGGGGQCADLCCSNAQCPAGTGCGLVGGLGGSAVRACAPMTFGSEPDGSVCSDDGESCAGGHCIENRCRRVCCRNADCELGWRCLPRTSPEGLLVPVCVEG